MMRKWKSWLPVVLVVAVVLSILGVRIYRKMPKNIFDELYYEVRGIENGRNSYLLTEELEPEKMYDFGQCEGVSLGAWNVLLNTGANELWFYISEFEETENGPVCKRSVQFWYEKDEKVLHGGQPTEYVVEKFLSLYFAFCQENGIKSRYSAGDLGEFSMEVQEYMDRDR